MSPVRFELQNFYPRGKIFEFDNKYIIRCLLLKYWLIFLLVFLYLTRLKARQILSRLVKNISLYFKRRHLIIYKKFSGFGKRKRPGSIEIQHDEDKKFPQSRCMPDSEPVSIGQDLWKQFRRVTILVFSGEKRTSKIRKQHLWLV